MMNTIGVWLCAGLLGAILVVQMQTLKATERVAEYTMYTFEYAEEIKFNLEDN